MITIKRVTPIKDTFAVRFTLSDGTSIERDFALLPPEGVFRPMMTSQRIFRRVRIVMGVPTWPGGVDFCPDVVLWGGLPPKRPRRPLKSAMLGAHGSLIPTVRQYQDL